MKTVYLAAKFSRREEMEGLTPTLRDHGYDCIARWVYGGEDGLTRSEIAELDLEDVAKANALIIFTHPRGEPQPGGGRFVEMGYALGLGKEVIVIGPHENVFTSTPSVVVYDTFEDFLDSKVSKEEPRSLSQDRKVG